MNPHPQRRLSPETVVAMRAQFARGGVTLAAIGQSYGISPATARMAVYGLTYAEIPGAVPYASDPAHGKGGRHSLSPHDEQSLRRLAAKGERVAVLAARFGIAWSTARSIIRRSSRTPKVVPISPRYVNEVCATERAKRANPQRHAELMQEAREKFARLEALYSLPKRRTTPVVSRTG